MIDNKNKITDFAGKIVEHGLGVPAVLFLEMVKYASFFGSQMLVFFGPVITVFINSEPFYQFADLLEDRKNVEYLLDEIERLEMEYKSKKLREKNEF